MMCSRFAALLDRGGKVEESFVSVNTYINMEVASEPPPRFLNLAFDALPEMQSSVTKAQQPGNVNFPLYRTSGILGRLSRSNI